MNCRHCGNDKLLPVLDLGSAPPSNAFLSREMLRAPEKCFPLKVNVCHRCWLVQTEDYTGANEIFSSDYVYFSSISESWLRHVRIYVDKMITRFDLSGRSHVVEVAANDGYLLQYVLENGIPCTGIEPTASTAAIAKAKGIPVVSEFFSADLAKRLIVNGKQADLVIANNVLAHVPDINDFVLGFSIILKPHGVASFEFPHLMQLLAKSQFDTIYHEHFSYLSLMSVRRIFESNGLSIFDVEELPTHGGSLRVFAQRSDIGFHACTPRLADLLERELREGVSDYHYYKGLQYSAETIKNNFLEFLLSVKRNGKTIAGYGAAAKGNTLINYAGVKSDLLPFVVDRAPSKLGKYLPGSHIPVVSEEVLKEARPDYVLVLPWNLRLEIRDQLSYIRTWGGKFVIAVPELMVD